MTQVADRGTFTQVPNVLIDSNLPETFIVGFMRLMRHYGHKGIFVGSIRKLSKVIHISKSTVARMVPAWASEGLVKLDKQSREQEKGDDLVITLLLADLWEKNRVECPKMGQVNSEGVPKWDDSVPEKDKSVLNWDKSVPRSRSNHALNTNKTSKTISKTKERIPATSQQPDTLSASADGTRALVFHPKYDFLALDDATTPTTLTVFMTYVSAPYWSEIEDKRREAIAMEVWNELATHGHTVVYCWKHEERPVWPVTVESEILTEEEPTDGPNEPTDRDLFAEQHSHNIVDLGTSNAQRAPEHTNGTPVAERTPTTQPIASPDEHTSIRLSDSSTRHAVPGDVIASPDTSMPLVDALSDVQSDTDSTLIARNPGVDAMTASDTASQELPIVTAQPAKPARGKKSIDGVPLVMPDGDAKWCAETAVEIIEVLKGRRYSETTRAKELSAATKALRVKHTTGQPVTREQFLVSWEKMSKWAVWKEKEIEPMIRHLLTDDRVIKLCGACVQQQTLLSASPVDAAAERARVASKNQAALDKIQAIVRKQQEAEQAQATAQKGA